MSSPTCSLFVHRYVLDGDDGQGVAKVIIVLGKDASVPPGRCVEATLAGSVAVSEEDWDITILNVDNEFATIQSRDALLAQGFRPLGTSAAAFPSTEAILGRLDAVFHSRFVDAIRAHLSGEKNGAAAALVDLALAELPETLALSVI